MTTLVALVSGTGWHVADLRRAAELLDIRFLPLPFPQVSARVGGPRQCIAAGDVDLTAVDGVLVRMMPPGSLEQVVFRMDALHRVAAAGVPVWNPPRAVEAAVDKFLTLALLDQAGLPVPPTWTGQTAVEALSAFDALGGDVVVKPLFGSEGRGLVRISDRELAWRSFHALERMGAVLYLQRMLRHPGHDLRALRAPRSECSAPCAGLPRRTNGEPTSRWEGVPSLCGLTRIRNAWRWPLPGPSARSSPVLTWWKTWTGVDLVVLEVNAVPGWRALSRVTGIDVATALLSELRDCQS